MFPHPRALQRLSFEGTKTKGVPLVFRLCLGDCTTLNTEKEPLRPTPGSACYLRRLVMPDLLRLPLGQVA